MTITGIDNDVTIGAGVRGTFILSIDASSCAITIGADVRAGGRVTVFMRNGPSRLRIGAACTFTAAARLLMHEPTDIVIGDDCMIAGNVDMLTSDVHPIFDAADRRINEAASISLGNHVWVCQGARILKGARIGSGCVVGMNAVVTAGEYPPRTMLLGTPARVTRTEIRWERKIGEGLPDGV